MTEYWVSQARHWCEYCRIYINGNAASIAFHENGKKHKEIVEMSLRDMRKRGRERRMEQNELDREMKAIEREAMKDYLAHDVARQPREARPPPMPAERMARLAQLEAQITADRLARSAAAAAMPTAVPPAPVGSTSASAQPDGTAALPPGWRAVTNPDGKTYYTHDVSGATQWDRPRAASDTAGAAGAPEGGGARSSADGARSSADGAWQQGWTSEGVPYYHNAALGLTQWEVPKGWEEGARAGGVKREGVGGADGGVGSEAAGAAASGADAEGGDAEAEVKVEAAAHGVAEELRGEEGAPPDEPAPGSADGGGDADDSTGYGAWTVVEPSAPNDESSAAAASSEKRQRVSWAGGDSDEDEEATVLQGLQASNPVPQEMLEAVARAEAQAEAARAEEEAGAAPVKFAKRKGGSGSFRKKTRN